MNDNWVSILDLIKNNLFEASIITTFNSYLPFYEEVVLRRLWSSGCRHNVLMMDSSQFSECLQMPSLRPSSAGFDYSLIPVKASGAFHPKIIFLVSKKKGLLFVGSHNITLSGLSINKELTTQINISGNNDDKTIQVAQDVWAYLLSWLEAQGDNVPEKIYEAFNTVKRFAPWLNKRPTVKQSDLTFIGSEPKGVSLWEKFKNKITGNVECITLLGPFFDEKIEFLKVIQNDLSPKKIIVGIDADTVSLPSFRNSDLNVKFVDASLLAKGAGYLHAKAMFVETEENNWLLTGSANPSYTAWAAPSSKRNAEAMIIHEGDSAKRVSEEIGILNIKNNAVITTEELLRIEKRFSEQKIQRKPKKQYGNNTAIAMAEKKSININSSTLENKDFIRADCYNENQQIITTIEEFTLSENLIMLPIDTDIVQKVRSIVVLLNKADLLICLVHHDRVIQERSQNSGQVQFRKALAGLRNDDPNIESLIALISKSIFESRTEINTKVLRSTSGVMQTSDDKENKNEIKSLSIKIDDTKKVKKKSSRIINSGSIGTLIDVLIHHLGVDLEKRINAVDSKGRTEEELVDSDDEETEDVYVELDIPKIVKLCNGKIKQLITRMIKNFEQADPENEMCVSLLMKLLAVLTLVREVRRFDVTKSGIPFGATFVPVDERKRLLESSLRYLFGKKHDFYQKAMDELVDESLDELSRLKGLLLWLAHDCGVDFYNENNFNVSYEERKNRAVNKSYFLLIAPVAVVDPLAFEETKNSIYQTSREVLHHKNNIWLEKHQSLGEKLYKVRICAHKLQKKIERDPRVGDVAFIRGEKFPRLHLVLQGGTNVILSEIDDKDGKQQYPSEKITSITLH